MGKKLQGAALRAKKRQQAAAELMQEAHAERVAAAAVVDQPDEQLFVLDTDGAIVPHHERPLKEETIAKRKRTVKVLTYKEKLEVERLLKTHSRQELVRMVQEGKALLDKVHVKTHGVRADRTQKANYDLWATNDDSTAAVDGNTKAAAKPRLGSAPAGISPSHVAVRQDRLAPRRSKRETRIAVEVAQSGQSYRPDPVVHKQALEQAKLVEARRLQAEEYNNTPISAGMSEETKALLVDDSDTSEDESSDDEDDDNNNVPSLHKRREKLTRAQRNKQKRLRVTKAIEDKQRKRRKMENSVAQIPRFKKEFRMEERDLQERKERIATVKEADKRTKGSKVLQAASEANPVDAPTFPIGLSSEVNKKAATLRTIKPKGSLVTDRIMSLRDRDLAAPVKGHKKMRRRKRKVAVKGKHNAGIEGGNFAVLG